jgi:hypothetical protein
MHCRQRAQHQGIPFSCFSDIMWFEFIISVGIERSVIFF